MKYILFSLVAIVMGCSKVEQTVPKAISVIVRQERKFKIGECAEYKGSFQYDEWTKLDYFHYIKKIKKIGNKSYLTDSIDAVRKDSKYESSLDFDSESRYNKVDCPRKLK